MRQEASEASAWAKGGAIMLQRRNGPRSARTGRGRRLADAIAKGETLAPLRIMRVQYREGQSE
jgi:hypothetical protein